MDNFRLRVQNRWVNAIIHELTDRLRKLPLQELPPDGKMMHSNWTRLLQLLEIHRHERRILKKVDVRIHYLDAWALDRYLRIRLVEIGEENEEFLAYQSLTAELANYL